MGMTWLTVGGQSSKTGRLLGGDRLAADGVEHRVDERLAAVEVGVVDRFEDRCDRFGAVGRSDLGLADICDDVAVRLGPRESGGDTGDWCALDAPALTELNCRLRVGFLVVCHTLLFGGASLMVSIRELSDGGGRPPVVAIYPTDTIQSVTV